MLDFFIFNFFFYLTTLWGFFFKVNSGLCELECVCVCSVCVSKESECVCVQFV